MGITLHFDLIFATTFVQTPRSKTQTMLSDRDIPALQFANYCSRGNSIRSGRILGQIYKIFADLVLSGILLVRYLLLSHARFSFSKRIYDV
jgi:hypothetical protein